MRGYLSDALKLTVQLVGNKKESPSGAQCKLSAMSTVADMILRALKIIIICLVCLRLSYFIGPACDIFMKKNAPLTKFPSSYDEKT